MAGGSLRNLILPTVALALPQVAYVARLTAPSMIEVLRSNYIRTARATGLPGRLVVGRHALRAAFLPVVSYLGPAIAGIITGSVVSRDDLRDSGHRPLISSRAPSTAITRWSWAW